MIQTVTLNSALSPNWVVCTVRTPRTQVTRALRQGRVHAVRWALCCSASCRIAALCRSAMLCRVVACWAPCRALLPLAPTRLLGRVPSHASPVVRLGPAYHNTTRYIATKTGKWAVAHSSLLSCTYFFFICSTHCKANRIFFFKSSNRTLETCFTYCKTNRKKNSLIIFFFIPLVASLLLLKCSSLNNCYLYNSKILRAYLQPFFLCKNWNNLLEFHKTQFVHVKNWNNCT